MKRRGVRNIVLVVGVLLGAFGVYKLWLAQTAVHSATEEPHTIAGVNLPAYAPVRRIFIRFGSRENQVGWREEDEEHDTQWGDNGVSGFAVDRTGVYVADFVNDRLTLFRFDGSVSVITNGGLVSDHRLWEASSRCQVMVGDDGTIYLGHELSVRALSPQGAVKWQVRARPPSWGDHALTLATVADQRETLWDLQPLLPPGWHTADVTKLGFSDWPAGVGRLGVARTHVIVTVTATRPGRGHDEIGRFHVQLDESGQPVRTVPYATVAGNGIGFDLAWRGGNPSPDVDARRWDAAGDPLTSLLPDRAVVPVPRGGEIAWLEHLIGPDGAAWAVGYERGKANARDWLRHVVVRYSPSGQAEAAFWTPMPRGGLRVTPVVAADGSFWSIEDHPGGMAFVQYVPAAAVVSWTGSGGR